MHQQIKSSVVLVSDPTWGNHNLIFKNAGFTDIQKYRYWEKDNRNLNLTGMIEDIKKAPENAVIILLVVPIIQRELTQHKVLYLTITPHTNTPAG